MRRTSIFQSIFLFAVLAAFAIAGTCNPGNGDDDTSDDDTVADDDTIDDDAADDDAADDDATDDDDDTVSGDVTYGDFVVFAQNDLGMHCMNEDFSKLMILPPYNTIHAQVVDRRNEDPQILGSNVTVSYEILHHTNAADDTNFWDYVDDLLGVSPAANVGLTGNGLSGTMAATGGNDWAVTGIPLTPVDDAGHDDAYPLAQIRVSSGGTERAATVAVAPVSWEIRCDYCHGNGKTAADVDILEAHDEMHGTNLANATPVFCGECHYQPPLAPFSQPGSEPTLSSAMHTAHASRMGSLSLENKCYACHPGVATQCLRGVHAAEGLTCTDCHGSMAQVGVENRESWVDEPRCGDCHTRAGFEFEQPGVLYRDAKGHHNIHCYACHGSPHAITPSTKHRDNLEAIGLQGHAGTIDTCILCHREGEDDSFPHRVSGGDDDDDDDKSM